MKKKFNKRSFLAFMLVVALTATMPMTAFATQTEDNVNSTHNGTVMEDVTKPGNGINNPYGVTTQEQGQSYNQATAKSNTGTDWKVEDDDDTIGVGTDTQTDINVWARISDASAKIYKIDIEWGAMKFEFNDGSGSWNTESHTYEGTTGGNPHWVNNYDNISEETSYEVGTNGTNNKITVTNHSNSAVNAKFLYTMVNASGQAGASGTAVTPFNDGGTGDGTYSTAYGEGFSTSYTAHGVHDVIGYFYGNNDEAAKAHTAIANTYDSGAATDISAWKYDNTSQYDTLTNAPTGFLAVNAKVNKDTAAADLEKTIVLPTADWSTKPSATGESKVKPWTPLDASDLAAALTGFNNSDDEDDPNYSNGERAANVYFAFSGQPDKGQGAFLPVFTKVGVITVTITPNDATEYNTAVTAP